MEPLPYITHAEVAHQSLLVGGTYLENHRSTVEQASSLLENQIGDEMRLVDVGFMPERL